MLPKRVEMASSGSAKSLHLGGGSAPLAANLRLGRSQPASGCWARVISSALMPSKKLYFELCSRTWSRHRNRQAPGPSKFAGWSGALNSPGAVQPGTAHLALAPWTLPCSLDCFVAIERLYIGAMNAQETGPVATEMLRRLNSALTPSRVELVDDSEQHRGHGGYNPAGESHFTLRIESSAFAGKNRVERQRMIYSALGDLMRERVHALSIRASVPGE